MHQAFFGAYLLLAACLPLSAAGQASPRHPTTRQEDIPTVTRRALPAVGLVVVSDKGGNGIAEGSGFLVSRDGKLVTNYHVIENAASAVVKFPNGAFYAVQGVLGIDKDKDLAVLKLSGTDFPFLPLGDSGKLQVGETVVAIGNPLALEATVSSGIISAVRELEAEGRVRVIQTTAPISPGSSGGVLLNLKGEVVGVTSFHLVSGQNLNFAVAADYVKPMLSLDTVMPFARDKERVRLSPGGAAQSSEGAVASSGVSKEIDIPKDWITLADGSPLTVRTEGDYIYEQADIPGDGKYSKELRMICDTKRQGSEWVGTCRYKILLMWGSLVTENWCSLELGEKITSVSPRKIEGVSQKWRRATSVQTCPTPGTEWEPFAYIPKD
jgi:S1-C subfamily serine protease